MKKDNVVFWVIVILSLVLRLLFIDKPTGFWHNEMVMYNQTIAGGIKEIINAAVNADVHFPLYQILLAGWIKIFGNGDIAIRMMSVIMGVLNVVFAFLAGKELKDKKLGNIFAFLTAINAPLIFYSQEVKFYIMLSLLVTMSLYFLIRILKKDKLKDYIGYVLTNAAIIYTFTIGILYVFAQGLAILALIIYKKRNLIKNFVIANGVLLLAILPFVIFLLTHFSKYEGAAWIFTSNIFTTFVLIQNYFSPYLIGVYNNPVVYIPTLGILTVIFVYIPVGLALYGIFRAVKEDKVNYFALAIPVLFLLFEVILCMNSGLRMLTRYTIMAICPFLLLVSVGFWYFKSRTLKIVIGYLLVINLFFLLAFPQSAVRGYRDLGQKPTALYLTEKNITDNDTIILALRKNDFDKYLEFEGRKFSLLQDFIHEEYAQDSTKGNKYEQYYDYVLNYSIINKELENDFLERVIDPMKKDARLFFIWDENYNSFPITTADEYKRLPVMTSSLSKINADTFVLAQKYLTLEEGIQLRHFRVFVFKKQKSY